jgi:hypothetical protein
VILAREVSQDRVDEGVGTELGTRSKAGDDQSSKADEVHTLQPGRAIAWARVVGL